MKTLTLFEEVVLIDTPVLTLCFVCGVLIWETYFRKNKSIKIGDCSDFTLIVKSRPLQQQLMDKVFKKIFTLGFMLASQLYAAQDNKTKLFMDKYLPHNKMKQFDLSPKILAQKSKDLNLSGMSTSMEINQTQFEGKYGTIPTLKSKNAQHQARQVSNWVRSAPFKKEVSANEKYILYDQSMNWSQYTGKYLQQLQNTKNQFLNSNEKLFIVISASLEKETISNYFKGLERVHTDVTFILRGLIGTPEKIHPTLDYIKGLLIKDPNKATSDPANQYTFNIQINPKITRRFDVKQVPAVLFIKHYNPVVQEYKGIIGTPDKDELYYIAYGEANIDYALEQINKKAKSHGIQRLLKAMHPSYYNKTSNAARREVSCKTPSAACRREKNAQSNN